MQLYYRLYLFFKLSPFGSVAQMGGAVKRKKNLAIHMHII